MCLAIEEMIQDRIKEKDKQIQTKEEQLQKKEKEIINSIKRMYAEGLQVEKIAFFMNMPKKMIYEIVG